MEMLDNLYIYAMHMAVRTREEIKNFFHSQDGVSTIVATIIVLLITVLLVGVFWDRLQEWLSGIMDQIFSTSIDASGLS